jgi:hypothetical protein
MSQTASPVLTVASLFAERDARRRKDREDEELLHRKKEEELEAFKHRLDEFRLTDGHVQAVLARIKRAFDNGETELMLTSFPSSFCSDGGRAVNNPEPPSKTGSGQDREPEWLGTLPAGARVVYDYWRTHLKPGGFNLFPRLISFKEGLLPGDIGLFISWPRSSGDLNR